jgi:foldase protein PrsA
LTVRHGILAAVVLAVAAFMVGCGNSPVAVVNGVKITTAEFNERLMEVAGRDVLRDMIDRELLRQAAVEAGIEVTEEELDAEIEKAKQEIGGEELFQQWLAGRELTEERWREHVRFALLTRKLALKDVKYTEEDLRKFFEENKQAFAHPATVSISEIVVAGKEDADEVMAELKKGASFGDIARRYSLSPTRERGGEWPEMPIDQIPIPAVREVAKTLPIGQVSQPIEAEGQWYIIKVRDRKPAREASFEADRKLIEEQYQLRHARSLDDILKEQIAKSNVRILEPRLQALNEIYTPVPSAMPEFGTEGAQPGAEAPTNAPAAVPPESSAPTNTGG